MKSFLLWKDELPERDRERPAVYCVAFTPDGKSMLAGAGNRVLMYDAETGALKNSLKGHKDTVYSISCSVDGKLFASGGADNQVILWTSTGEGKLKFTHTSTIQSVCFNPTSSQLVSATAQDFGLWSTEQKNVSKTKVASRILSVSWSPDGRWMALSCYNGLVSIRDREGQERYTIQRTRPIWSVSWAPLDERTTTVTGASLTHTLAVTCWDQTLSFYKHTGQQIGKDKALKYDPCFVQFTTNGDYLYMGGSDRKVTLWTKEGVPVGTVYEGAGWVWSVAQRPNARVLGIATNDGKVLSYQVETDRAFAFHRDRFAYRHAMTQVVVQCLGTEQRARIKSRDFVRHVAVYKNLLAIQLTDQIVTYDVFEDESFELQVKQKDRVHRKADNTILVLTNFHLILAGNRQVSLLSFQGVLVREWSFESNIQCLRVVGGPSKREGLLLGFQDGSVQRLFVDCPFAVQVWNGPFPIVSCDFNSDRSRLGIVDSRGYIRILDMTTKMIVFEQNFAPVPAAGGYSGTGGAAVDPFTGLPVVREIGRRSAAAAAAAAAAAGAAAPVSGSVGGVVSSGGMLGPGGAGGAGSGMLVPSAAGVAGSDGSSGTDGRTYSSDVLVWNADHPDMWAATVQGRLILKTCDFPVQVQEFTGTIISYKGSRIHYVEAESSEIQPYDVPQSHNLARLLDKQDYPGAYKVACLGVPETDWRRLGMIALVSLQLDVARKCFLRLRDLKYITFVSRMEDQQRQQDFDETLAMANVLAFQGHYTEAAKLYVRMGRQERALELFTDLKMWKEVERFMKSMKDVDIPGLMRRRAQWALETGQPREACEILVAGGFYHEAVDLCIANEWTDLMASLVPLDSAASSGGSVMSSSLSAAAASAMGSFGSGFGGFGGTGGSSFMGILSLKTDKEGDRICLEKVALFLRRKGLWEHAKCVYQHLRATKQLMSLYVDLHAWKDAFRLFRLHPELRAEVFLPYAQWLAINDRFDAAQRAFQYANRPIDAIRIIEQMTRNAVTERRFSDTAYYCQLLARELMRLSGSALQILKTLILDPSFLFRVGAGLSGSSTALSTASGASSTALSTSSGSTGSNPLGLSFMNIMASGPISSSNPSNALISCLQNIRLSLMAAASAAASAAGNSDAGAVVNAGTSNNMNTANVIGNALMDRERLQHFGCTLVNLCHSLANSWLERSEMYYAYHYVHQYVVEPFTSMDPLNLFHMARYLFMKMYASIQGPLEISRLSVTYALAKLSKRVRCFKLARMAFDRLQSLKLPPVWQDQIDLASLLVHDEPYTDEEDLMPLCYRCSATNPLINPNGDICVNCFHPFVRAFYSFDTLPLVEFHLGSDVVPLAVPKLIGQQRQQQRRKSGKSGSGGRRGDMGGYAMGGGDDDDLDDDSGAVHEDGVDRLMIDSASGGGVAGARMRMKRGSSQGQSESMTLDAMIGDSDDGFQQIMMQFEPGSDFYQPIVVDRETLTHMNPSHVFIVRRGGPNTEAASSTTMVSTGASTGSVEYRYYKLVLPDVAVVMCHSCYHFFHDEDWEFCRVTNDGRCPFCRSIMARVNGSVASMPALEAELPGSTSADGGMGGAGGGPGSDTGDGSGSNSSLMADVDDWLTDEDRRLFPEIKGDEFM